eukprot:5548529-Prymnesium_polylepis.1
MCSSPPLSPLLRGFETSIPLPQHVNPAMNPPLPTIERPHPLHLPAPPHVAPRRAHSPARRSQVADRGDRRRLGLLRL